MFLDSLLLNFITEKLLPMFSRIDIEERLMKIRNQRVEEQNVMDEVFQIFSKNEKTRKEILFTLTNKPSSHENAFNFELLDGFRIFHEDDIKKICTLYRLRFLNSHYFKGDFPEEAVSEIRRLEVQHQSTLGNFKIMAPAKLLKLENADDPLLFAPMGNGYYYLIHKWGRDLHPLRKLMMWPFKSMENLVFVIFLMSIVLTAISPMHWFSKNPGNAEYIFMFLVIFKGIIGLTMFYGFAKGKNFNGVIWESKYYNG